MELLDAASEGDVVQVEQLVSAGASVDVSDEQGRTALMKAAENGHVGVVRYLVEHGTPSDNGNESPLTIAAGAGHLDVVRFLVEYGAALDTRDNNGETPIMRAASDGHLDVVRYLVEFGAAVDASSSDGRTPLMWAALGGHLDVVRFLVEYGAAVDGSDNDGRTPLMWAAGGGHLDVVRFLVKFGAAVNASSSDGWTSLMRAAENGHLDMVRILVEYGAAVNASSSDGWTSLMRAAENGHLDMVRILVEYGAAVNASSSDGRTPLMLAARDGRWDMARILVKHGAAVDACSSDGWTLLMRAASGGHLDMVRILVEGGAAVDAQDSVGLTPLMKAVDNGYLNVVQLLVKYGANVNLMSSAGDTALSSAIRCGRQEIVQFLFPFVRSQDRRTQTENHDQHAARSSNIPSSWLISPFEIEVEPFVNAGNIGGDYRGKWLDADVVVKLFVDDASSATFVDEVRLWHQLRHPNVLKLYGVCNTDHYFFVCEYASNGSLPEYLKSCDAEHQTPWKFLLEAALGLEYLHERKIVHGSLRGSNILIGSDGLAKLSGFGLSASSSEERWHTSGSLVRWMAPEILKGEPVSLASDVYSLGMCILETVTGKVPYDGRRESTVRLAMKYEGNGMIYLKDQLAPLPDEQQDLVLAMCRDKPRERLQMPAMVNNLERLADIESKKLAQHTAQLEPEPLMKFDAFDEFNRGKMSSLWIEVKTLVDQSKNAAYRQIYQDLALIYDALNAESHPWSTLQCYCDLLAECRHAVDTMSKQNRIYRLSATRARDHSIQGLYRRISQLLQLVRPQDQDVETREAEWKRLFREQVEIFVSETSEACVLLNSMDSEEDRLALVTVLRTELRNSDGKYTEKQLAVLQKTCDDIVSKSLEDIKTTPEWFIPWFELEMNEILLLGQGGFGSVIRAKWLDSEVVVKKLEIDPKDAANVDKKREMRQMFEREVDIWFGLSHPHVVRLFGACHVGRPFFVCELAPNGTLVEYLRRHPDELWSKLREATLGVQYLHARGIVHGDLKGNNIMIGSDGKAKVTDFGLSGVFGDDSTEVMLSGAWHWVAPECMLKQKPTFASDIYSLAMCIIEALRVTNGDDYTLPWGDLPNAAVKFNVTRRHFLPPRPRNCLDEAWTLIERMCKSDPADRMLIMTVVDELEKLAGRHVDLSGETDKMFGYSGELRRSPLSVADELTEVKSWIGKRDAKHDWESSVLKKVYQLLWDRLEQVATQLFPDVDDTGISKSIANDFSTLVEHSKQRTQEALGITGDIPLVKFTELALGGYAMHRRLDKFMAAHAVPNNLNSLHDWMSACNSIMDEGENFTPNYKNESKIAKEATRDSTLTASSMEVICETKPAVSTEASLAMESSQVSTRDIDDSMGTPVATDIESNIIKSQQQIEMLQLADQLDPVDPAQTPSDEISVTPPIPSVDEVYGQQPSVVHQPQQSHGVARQLQEMKNESSSQMVIFKHLVQRLSAAVDQADSQCVDDYVMYGLTGIVEQVFDSFVIFIRHYHASIADVLHAPVMVTRVRAYHSELDELEQICGFKHQKWEENWQLDCEAFVELFHGLKLECASGDEEETGYVEEEIERTAQFIRDKYIESMPPTEQSLITTLFDEYLVTSDKVVEFQSWFIPMAECQQHPRLPAVHIWNGIDVKVLRFPSSSKEQQKLCREHADKMAGLIHPHMVRLLGACDVGVPFFVVENIESTPLIEYVKEHSPSRDDIWLAIFDVALALQWLHEHNVVCDALSSSCIVVEPNGHGRLDLHSPQRDRFGEGELSETHFGRPTTTAADIYNFASCIREALKGIEGTILEIEQPLLNDMMNDDPNLRLSMEVVITEMFRLVQPDPQWSPRLESFVIRLEPSAWNDLMTACSLHTRGRELFRIVIGYIERLVDEGGAKLPTFLQRTIVSYLTFIQQYICSPVVVQLAQVRHMMQSTQRMLEQVDDFLKQTRVKYCQQGVWEKPFAIHCESLVQEWMEWLQDADVVSMSTNDDALTALTMIKYEWDTHFRVLSDSVQALFRTAFGVVSSEACVCVMTTAPWFIPPYQISHTHFSNERVMVKTMSYGNPIREDKDKVSSKVVEQASLWSKMYHPNILRFVGANHVGDLYMIFEAASSTLREKPDDQHEIWCRLHEAAMGLEYLHSQGVAHGQLNCEAIIICDGSSFEKDHSVAKLVSTDLVSTRAWHKSGLGTSALETDLRNFARCIVEVITKTTIDKDGDSFVVEDVEQDLRDQMGDEACGLVRNMLSTEFGKLSYVVETLARFKVSGSSIELKSPKTKKSPKEILAMILDERMANLKKQLKQMGSTGVDDASMDDISRQLEQFGAEISLYTASKRSTTITFLAIHQKLDKLMKGELWRSFSDSELHKWAERFRR